MKRPNTKSFFIVSIVGSILSIPLVIYEPVAVLPVLIIGFCSVLFLKNEYDRKTTEDSQERQKLENELEQQRALNFHQEKLAVLGDMAGSLAHEINNPLAIIAGTSQAVRIKAQRGNMSPEELALNMDKIESTATRISKIINSLRVIARDGYNKEFTEADVTIMIEETRQFWTHRLESMNIQFTVQDLTKGALLECRPAQITICLLNIVSNAYQAVGTGSERWIRVVVCETRDNIEFRVTDSGPGVPPELREKIFDPFFTTKKTGEGSGIGLTVSKVIATEHKGHLGLDLQSHNTCFVLSLPKKISKSKTKSAA